MIGRRIYMLVRFFFFFKQKTAYEMRISDWSSDVCSSDLAKGRIDTLGLGLATLTPQLRGEFSIGDQVEGVVVTEVDPNGTAGEKGLRPGDVIVEVAQDEVRSPDEVDRGVKAAAEKGRKSVLLLIARQGGRPFVAPQHGRAAGRERV